MSAIIYPILALLILLADVAALIAHHDSWVAAVNGFALFLCLIGQGAIVNRQLGIQSLLTQQNRLLIAVLQSKGVEVTKD